MADKQWILNRAMTPEASTFGLQTRVLMSLQAEVSASFRRVALPGDRWVCEMQFNGTQYDMDQQLREAYFADLGGQQNNALIWHPRKLAPLGTLRGAPQVQSTSNNKVLSLRFAVDGQTLLPGDMFKANNQLFMATEAVVVAGGGLASISVAPPVRGAFDWTTLQWDKPTAKFVLDGQEVLIPYSPGKSGGDGFAVRFVEVF